MNAPSREWLTCALMRQLEDPQVRQMSNGVCLIGRLPSVGSAAYLHAVFPPVPLEEFQESPSLREARLPLEFREFLTECNGVILFQGALSLYGFRRRISRDPELREPFSWDERNTMNRPQGAQARHFFIGSFNWDGSLIYLDADNPGVFRRALRDPAPLNRWDSIWVMLEVEISRIGQLFDRFGNELNENVPTAPAADY